MAKKLENTFYNIKAKYIFEGVWKIKAKNKAQAKEFAEKQCAFTRIKGPHSLIDEDDVDWEFPLHPTQQFFSTK